MQLEALLTRFTDGPMPTIPVEIMIDVPAGVTVGEYERIDNGHSFHVSWEFPSVCVCETCKREKPLNLVDKDKFRVIRDLDIWGQPSFFVYQERLHRCPHCGHRQSMIPPFKRRDVKYTYRFEELVLVSLIKSTAEDVAKQLGISAETVERIVKNRIEDAKAMKVDPQRVIKNIGMDETQPAQRAQGLRHDFDGLDRSVQAGSAGRWPRGVTRTRPSNVWRCSRRNSGRRWRRTAPTWGQPT